VRRCETVAFALALIIGIIAGLRAMTGAAAGAWAAYLGVLPVAGIDGRS
jgi:uncharacterized membrane protein